MSIKILTVAVKKCILGGMFKRQIILMGFIAGLISSLVHAEPEINDVAPAENTVAVTADTNSELYRMMFESNLINAEEYQHALEHGSLSGDGTIANATIAPEKQITWNTLHAQGVITSKELVQMLSAGTMGNLTSKELKAFEELAPVYEPNRAKRLKYQVRKKHIAVNMIRFRQTKGAIWQKKNDDAHRIAIEKDIPIRIVTTNGGFINCRELYYFDDDGLPQYNSTMIINAARTISADDVWPTNINPSANDIFNLDGSGVRLGLMDAGKARLTHVELTGRFTQNDSPSLWSDHPTMVGGTMAGAGTLSACRGMAFAANVDCYNWGYEISMITAMVDDGIRFSNHSYCIELGWEPYGTNWQWLGNMYSSTEDPAFGRYGDMTRDLDELSYSAPYYLHIRSANNENGEGPSLASQPIRHWWPPAQFWSYKTHDIDGQSSGFDCLTERASIKNGLVVGAVRDLTSGYQSPGSVILEAYSACGPTDDGRIKPDIVANGRYLRVPTKTSDSSYRNYISGTSFAAPSITGALGLLQQLHERHHGTNAPLWASTYKALLIHTADECGSARGPDYKFGWGLANIPAAAGIIESNAQYSSSPHILQLTIADGDYAEWTFEAADTNRDIILTGTWTDPAGEPQPVADGNGYAICDPTDIVLVNDMDLRIISPDSQTNYPWCLERDMPSAAATRGDNIRDNVEQIVITNVMAGLYTVFVIHKGSLTNGAQDITVIQNNNIPKDPPILIKSANLSTNNVAELQWNSRPGRINEICTITDLIGTGAWQTVDNIPITKEITEWTDVASTNSVDTLFYRIKESY